jgi:CBS domain-containing protein
MVMARDLLDTTFPTVKLDTPLSQAMKFMIKREVIELPVLSDEGKVLGCIHEHDLIDFYHREILSKASMLKTVQHAEGREACSIEFEDEYRIEAVPSNKKMWGHNLIDLKLRENFNILVLAVRERSTGKGTMSPTKTLDVGDVLIAAGTKEDIDRFKAAFK